ncbi:MAG TPA: type-F conjugative transfer system secretin TraK [Gammaproteobacteria bacterium]|nr:type-F conjugative transfer system secretin TraK [Gammaproteobacteria bacterium]
MSKILLSIASVLFCAFVAAQQQIPVQEGTEVSITVSSNTLNRLAVENDRIMTVKGITGQFQLDKDGESGQVFIKPIATDKQELIHLFLLTEKGHTYPLSLTLHEGAAESILLMPSQSEPAQWEQSSSYETLLRTLVQAMHNQTPVEGFIINKIKTQIPIIKQAKVSHLQTYTGKQLQGHVLEIINTSKEELILTEQLFSLKGVRAVSILNPILCSRAKTRVYVVN